MLVISLKERESFAIEPIEGIDRSLTLQDAFAHGAIVVTLVRVGARRVRLAIDAPDALRISRRAAASADPEAARGHPRRGEHAAPREGTCAAIAAGAVSGAQNPDQPTAVPRRAIHADAEGG